MEVDVAEEEQHVPRRGSPQVSYQLLRDPESGCGIREALQPRKSALGREIFFMSILPWLKLPCT